jgi:hypothetical protein
MNAQTDVTDAVDHLLLGAADLDAGIAWAEERTGVRAVVGGSHPGRGTRNALLSLGERHYLEIIAPDPEQSSIDFRVDLRGLKEPRLVNWAARSEDVAAVARMATEAKLHVIGPRGGSRVTPAGATLRWQTVTIDSRFGQGSVEPVPFFIQWGEGVQHPAENSPSGCVLKSLTIAHPDATGLGRLLRTVGLPDKVAKGPEARLTAVLKTTKGTVRLS